MVQWLDHAPATGKGVAVTVEIHLAITEESISF